MFRIEVTSNLKQKLEQSSKDLRCVWRVFVTTLQRNPLKMQAPRLTMFGMTATLLFVYGCQARLVHITRKLSIKSSRSEKALYSQCWYVVLVIFHSQTSCYKIKYSTHTKVTLMAAVMERFNSVEPSSTRPN